MKTIMNMIRPDLRDFHPYRSARDEARAGRVWLNANESPYTYNAYGLSNLNRYPEKQPHLLLQRLAEIYHVSPQQILLSRGSDEGIDLLVRLCCEAGKDSIMTCSPTYGMYSVSARLQNAHIIDVPLDKDQGFQLNEKALLAQWNKSVKILFLCSPNNPTGHLLNKKTILELCQRFSHQSLIVVDEAYIEFADSESLSTHLQDYPNLVVLRTVSKAYGLAGARFGLVLAHTDLIHYLLKIIAPYPIPAPISQLLLTSFAPERLQQVRQQIDLIKAERTRLVHALSASPWVKRVWPSQANFLLLELHQAERLMQTCAEKGVILRSMFDKPGLDNMIRMSIGTPTENDEVMQLLTSLRPS